MMVLIDGYDDYLVDEYGQVFSTKRNGFRKMNKSKHLLGYELIRLSKDGVSKSLTVHRLVAKAFLPADADRQNVNHKNGIRNDNRVENLEWCTQKENVHHAVNRQEWWGLTGENHPDAKLNWQRVDAIKALLSNGVPQRKIANQFGVSQKTILNIAKNRIWQHARN